MKYIVSIILLVCSVAAANAAEYYNILQAFGLSAPTCLSTTPNIRPPKCVDYNRVFARAPICSSANPSVLPPYCSAIDVPSSALTPGSAFSAAQLVNICADTYPASIPLPTTLLNETTQQLFVSYGFPFKQNIGPCVDGCVVDNLIPIGLGGDNTLANLWPQPAVAGIWTSVKKDELEAILRSRVCTVTAPHTTSLDIKVARSAITTDWKQAYVTYVTNQQ